MLLFSAIVTRDVTESVQITVEADSLEKAEDKLLSAANNDANLKWALDDNTPHDAYLGDPHAVEELDPEDYKGYIAVEWHTDHRGGDWDRMWSDTAIINRRLITLEGSVEAAFQKHSGHDPVHIISYNEDDLVDEHGDPLDK